MKKILLIDDDISSLKGLQMCWLMLDKEIYPWCFGPGMMRKAMKSAHWSKEQFVIILRDNFHI